MTRQKVKLAAAFLLAASGIRLAAQSINPPTNPQTAPMTGHEKKNLQFALDFTREVLQARHTEYSPNYQAEDYIQHNPNIPTGRAAFVAFFSRRPPVKSDSRQAGSGAGGRGRQRRLRMVGHGARRQRSARDPSNTYHYNSFDVYRLANGKIQEHWDSAPAKRRLRQGSDAGCARRNGRYGQGIVADGKEEHRDRHSGAQGHAAIRAPGIGR